MKKILLFIIPTILFCGELFSQNVGIGTTSPTHPLHLLSPTGQDPLKVENFQLYATENSFLVVNPVTGIVKYMPKDSLLSVIPNLDSIILNSVLSQSDTIYANQTVIDSILSIVGGSIDSIIISKSDTLFTFIRDSLMTDTTFINWLDTSYTDDQNIDSLTLTGTILTTYIEDGLPSSVDLQPIIDSALVNLTGTDDQNLLTPNLTGTVLHTHIENGGSTNIDLGTMLDSVILSKSDTLYSLISDSLLQDSVWIDSLISLIGDSINTDDQNIDSLTLTGTILTTYIEDGLPASIDLQPIIDSALANSTGTDDQNLLTPTLTGTVLHTHIENGASTSINLGTLLDSVILSKSDTLYSIISDSLLQDSVWIDSLISLIGDSINTDDQNIDSLTLTGTILTTYIEDGLPASIDLQPIIDSAIANSSGTDNDWDINVNGTGLEGIPGDNVASGNNSIAAGRRAEASGVSAVAFGGDSAPVSVNRASGNFSTVSGGSRNEASNSFGTVIGGVGNVVGGYASIGGGYQNTVSGGYSVGLGGRDNIVSGGFSVVVGGNLNIALGSRSFVGGGVEDTASGDYSVVVGGQDNNASGINSIVVGGTSNQATGRSAYVGGGFANIASGTNSTNTQFGYGVVVGGYGNNATEQSAIVGGRGNIATNVGFVGGGRDNRAVSGGWSVVGGGQDNTASGIWSGVLGGELNTASGSLATIAGGLRNSSSANWSTISGGSDNVASGNYATVSGGRNNTAQSYGEWVGGVFATIGTGNPTTFVSTDRLFVVGNGTGTATRSNAFHVLKNGNAFINGVTAVTSDKRLKEKIVPLEGSLDKLLKLNGYTYYWKDNGIRSRDKQIGLLSQEVEALYPELIMEVEGIKGLNYQGLTPILIEAIKEQQKIIDTQNEQIETLIEEIENIKKVLGGK